MTLRRNHPTDGAALPYKPGDLADHTTRGRALYAANRGDTTARDALREYRDAMRALGKATFGDDDTDTSDDGNDTPRGINAGRATYQQRHHPTTGDDAA